jgi:beta-phosphoglucomutase
VLVSTDELHYRSWKELADAEGIPFDRQTNHRLRGVSRMKSLEIVLERSKRAYSDDEKRSLAERKNRAYRKSVQALSPADILPGVKELIYELRNRGIKMAVASNSKNAVLILERLGWANAFDAVVDGKEITHSKPHPEVFLLAAERLGVLPGQCLVVEDAAAGIEAARRAGMAVFGIGSPDNLPEVEHWAPNLMGVTADRLVAAAGA